VAKHSINLGHIVASFIILAYGHTEHTVSEVTDWTPPWQHEQGRCLSPWAGHRGFSFKSWRNERRSSL